MAKNANETDKERQERERVEFGVLGDIQTAPDPATRRAMQGAGDGSKEEEAEQEDEPMDGGSQHGDSKHPGSREMTEGTTGGAGTEVGGTRNFRQGTGFSSGDIGNRPE
jgi:hypothetical protein